MTGQRTSGRAVPPLLACEGLTVRYVAASDVMDADKPALADVSLAVHPGEIVGLVGRNGAGKSTLIRTAAGLLAPTGGMVRVVGRDPATEPAEVMRHAGFLLSDPALFAYLSAAETLAVVADQHGLEGEVAARRVAELLTLVELEEVRDRRVGGYSTGMAKRLSLACALLPTPSLLVLDEPFESLDPLVVRRLTRALGAQRDGGVGVLLSSHLLATVAELCDRVVLIDRGRVLAEGTVPGLIAAHAPAGEATLDGAYAALIGDV
ncbi:MAG: ABC transporter ATP-binding protein [Gemmatimonadetes bacterium]|nr:ABC transporter ATP-binding protein [Gemmatimonadota bacterium]